MTDGAPHPADLIEQDPLARTPYARSTEQLFNLLEAATDAPAPCFYTVAWNAEDPARVDNITVMAAVPSGARRREHAGLFHSAQFRVTEASYHDDSGQERFIWCATSPQQRDEPVTLDVASLAPDYDYQALNADSIVSALADRASSLDDYVELVRTMSVYGVGPVPALTKTINHLIYRFAQGKLGRTDKAPGDQDDQDKMFELITLFQAVGAGMPREAQGYLASQLLRAISLKAIRATPEFAAISDNAASILEAAITQGVIPRESTAMERVLGGIPIYNYPFATEVLYAQLEAGYNRGTPMNAFGIWRSLFACNYIATIARSSNPSLTPLVDTFLRTGYYGKFHERDPHRLYGLLNGLTVLVGGQVSVVDGRPQPAEIPEVSALTDVGRAFGHLLSELHGGASNLTDEQAEFNRKCVAIVETVLAPTIRQQIGKQAVAAADTDM
ncbi:MAG TPA: hypothetical protein VLH84_02440 [Patescibacteria group bacterium]|nr:hypothetical protein [Patescibacteria group bacterium]